MDAELTELEAKIKLIGEKEMELKMLQGKFQDALKAYLSTYGLGETFNMVQLIKAVKGKSQETGIVYGPA